MMIIPSINVKNYNEARQHFDLISKLAVSGLNIQWIHIDIADGSFTQNVTWQNTDEFKSLKLQNIKTEVHLMVEDIPAHLPAWAGAGIQRAIVHVEALNDVEYVLEICAQNKVAPGLAIAPETPADELNVYFNKISFYQILAVLPGKSGQIFDERALDKIKFLRTAAPHAMIEVDGGITPETARRAKEAGADSIVSASYIWGSSDPRKAYGELQNV